MFCCRVCGDKGNHKTLAQRLGLGAPAQAEKGVEAVYDYHNEAGLLYQVIRRPGKQFRQRRPDGNGGWFWNLKNTRRVFYRVR